MVKCVASVLSGYESHGRLKNALDSRVVLELRVRVPQKQFDRIEK
jgi:hypothetical protein